MLNKIYSQLLPATIAITMLSLVARAFTEANNLPSANMLYLYLIAISLVISLDLPGFIEFPLDIILAVATCFSYFNYGQSFSWSWFKVFFQNSFVYFLPSYRSTVDYVPENMALIIFLIVFFILMKLVLDYENWQMIFIFSLIYPIILMIANKDDLNRELVIISVCGLVLAASLRSAPEDEPKPFSPTLMVLTTISLLSFLAWNGPIVFPEFQQGMEELARPLNELGQSQKWYHKITTDGRGGANVSGFSENDSVLGGPIRDGKGVAFEVEADNPHYWKVATRDSYTGKGWRSTDNQREKITESPLIIDNFVGDYEVDGEEITVKLRDNESFLPKPDGKIVWEFSDQTQTDANIEYNQTDERIYLDLSRAETASREFSYTFFAPDYERQELIDAPAIYRYEDQERYLHLPEDLPNRVFKLAYELVDDDMTDYQKVEAIETYLKYDKRFSYSLSGAKHVPSERDYVDFFLFDSPVGYCEHFSSAMIVLVRSLGLPARWVKGFNEGRVVEKLGDGRKLYQISHKNAHAWAEVYFEGFGWVPFEPTKTFNNQFQVANEEVENPNERPVTPEEDPVVPEEKTEASNSTTETELSTKEDTNASHNKPEMDKSQKWMLITAGGLTLAISGLLVYFQRYYLAWRYFRIKVKWLPRYSFQKSFQDLLKLLNVVVVKTEDQTLANYSRELSLLSQDWEASLAKVFDQGQSELYRKATTQANARDFSYEYQQIEKVVLTLKKNKNN